MASRYRVAAVRWHSRDTGGTYPWCISEECSVRDWNSHDLRRTVASHLAGSGVSRLVIKTILNHADRDITAVYDRYEYAQEKKLALEAWDRKIQAISEGTRDTGHVLSFNTLKK
jgi:hypothetical protein